MLELGLAENDEAKPVVQKIEKFAMSSSGYTNPGDYEDFIQGNPLDQLFGGHEMSDRALYEYVQENYPEVDLEPFTDETTVEDIEQALIEANVGIRDNTYNWAYWGPVLVFQLIGPAAEEPYSEGVIIVSRHLGGDVRGNYAAPRAFKLKTYAEEVPWYDVTLGIRIETDQGNLWVDSSDVEGYEFYVSEDETGIWEEGDTITSNDLESGLDWDEEGVYLW